jgi:hypothetical protein
VIAFGAPFEFNFTERVDRISVGSDHKHIVPESPRGSES